MTVSNYPGSFLIFLQTNMLSFNTASDLIILLTQQPCYTCVHCVCYSKQQCVMSYSSAHICTSMHLKQTFHFVSGSWVMSAGLTSPGWLRILTNIYFCAPFTLTIVNMTAQLIYVSYNISQMIPHCAVFLCNNLEMLFISNSNTNICCGCTYNMFIIYSFHLSPALKKVKHCTCADCKVTKCITWFWTPMTRLN